MKLHLIDILEIKAEGDDMEFEFEFINALFLFLIIPGITIFYIKSNSKNRKSVLKFSSLQILEKSSSNNKFRKHFPFGITMCVLGMIIIALANPQILTPDGVKPINFVVVLDGSESMSATDYSPTRLESAKKSIISVISEMNTKNNVLSTQRMIKRCIPKALSVSPRKGIISSNKIYQRSGISSKLTQPTPLRKALSFRLK